MKIVIFTHPPFSKAHSINKYTGMIAKGLMERGHSVDILTAKSYLYRLPVPKFLKKWLGYLDQFIIFPIRFKASQYQKDTLFVFADQALGPWVPLISNRPHVIHCHDFLAQRSALNEIPENRIGISGKIYQKLIRKGYRKGKNFISISLKTQTDLHRFLKLEPLISKVVYNGFNLDFKPGDVNHIRNILSKEWRLNLNSGYILHVGGNQFYKNRKGVLKIYITWRETYQSQIPLVMIGPEPPDDILKIKSKSQYAPDIHFFTDIDDDLLIKAYQGASILLYPSQEEGFGWPIAEAMASGCPVITTNKAPMNEVGGEDCIYIPSFPEKKEFEYTWLKHCSRILENSLNLSTERRQKLIEFGLINSKRFTTENAMKQFEMIYQEVIENYPLILNKITQIDPDPQV